MVGKGRMSMAEWKAMREPLAERLATAEAALARSDAGTALARLTGDTSTLADRWDELDTDFKRRLISLVLDHVEVAKGRRSVLDLDRVTPVWKA